MCWLMDRRACLQGWDSEGGWRGPNSHFPVGSRGAWCPTFLFWGSPASLTPGCRSFPSLGEDEQRSGRKGSRSLALYELGHPAKAEVRVTAEAAQHPQTGVIPGPPPLEGWHGAGFWLQLGLGPLAMGLVWWQGEEGEQPHRGCGRLKPLWLRVPCAGAGKSAEFSLLPVGDCGLVVGAGPG